MKKHRFTLLRPLVKTATLPRRSLSSAAAADVYSAIIEKCRWSLRSPLRSSFIDQEGGIADRGVRQDPVPGPAGRTSCEDVSFILISVTQCFQSSDAPPSPSLHTLPSGVSSRHSSSDHLLAHQFASSVLSVMLQQLKYQIWSSYLAGVFLRIRHYGYFRPLECGGLPTSNKLIYTSLPSKLLNLQLINPFSVLLCLLFLLFFFFK